MFGIDLRIFDDSEAAISREMEARSFAIDDQRDETGNLSFYGDCAFHRAAADRSSMARSVMTSIYLDAEMCVAKTTDGTHRQRLAK